MSENRYTYGTWKNLRPVDVFALVAFDETRKQLGLDDLAAASAMLLGQSRRASPWQVRRGNRGHVSRLPGRP